MKEGRKERKEREGGKKEKKKIKKEIDTWVPAEILMLLVWVQPRKQTF